jgi:pyrroloquinoline quinone (PQQ) biosynthesis protein C
MTTNKSGTPNVVEVWSDGGYLSQSAVAVLTEASSGTATRIVERNVNTISPKEIDGMGIRATPTVISNGTVAFVGIPSPEDAFVLVKRAEIDRVILEWAVSKSQALRQFAEGNSSNKSIALSLAREFQPFCFEFPLFLAAAISHVRDDKSRLLLVSNLYEEHGNLELDRFHPTLFRKFMRGIGVEPDSLELDPASPGVQAAQHVTAICREGPAYKALATLYAIELSFAPICDVIVAGLKHLKLSAETEYFWILHSGADVEHAEQLRAALLNVCRSPEEWHSAVELAGEISQMFFTLFDYIARADVVTTDAELEVYDTVKRICGDSPSAAKYPVQYKDAVYYFGINLGPADRWFLRAFCDARRHSLVSRLPLQQVAMLAPGFVTEAAPPVFGASRVYFDKPQDLEKARALVLSAYEREVKRAETGSVGEEAASW